MSKLCKIFGCKYERTEKKGGIQWKCKRCGHTQALIIKEGRDLAAVSTAFTEAIKTWDDVTKHAVDTLPEHASAADKKLYEEGKVGEWTMMGKDYSTTFIHYSKDSGKSSIGIPETLVRSIEAAAEERGWNKAIEYSGEFKVTLPRAREQGAQELAEKIRKVIEKNNDAPYIVYKISTLLPKDTDAGPGKESNIKTVYS